MQDLNLNQSKFAQCYKLPFTRLQLFCSLESLLYAIKHYQVSALSE